MKYEELIKELRKHGLQNGYTPGWHSGLIDNAADAIEQLMIENDKLLTIISDIKTCACCTHTTKSVMSEPCVSCNGGDHWQWRYGE